MTTKEMEKLYATGEWICVRGTSMCKDWFIDYNPKFNSTDILEYKLIHINHKEALDDVLNGGEVKYALNEEYQANKIDDFIESYNPSCYYEIIPPKQDGSLEHEKNIQYGCHVDLEDSQEPDGCVIDNNQHHHCVYAKEGMNKEECQYWKPYNTKSEPPNYITMTHEQIKDACEFNEPEQILDYVKYLEANQKDK